MFVVSVMFPVCPVHGSDCGQCSVPCMPNTPLWLWSVFPSYALDIAMFVVSVMFPVCPVHSFDCGQCSLAMPSTQLWLWSVYSLHTQCTTLIVVSMSPVYKAAMAIPTPLWRLLIVLVMTCSLYAGIPGPLCFCIHSLFPRTLFKHKGHDWWTVSHTCFWSIMLSPSWYGFCSWLCPGNCN